MIRGFIDFNTLDSKQSFVSTTLGRGVTFPGFQLEVDSDEVRSFAYGQRAMLVIGKPRVRNERLAQDIA